MFKSILVAIDGSDAAFKALDLASDIAAKYSARLTLVHASPLARLPERLERYAEPSELDDVPHAFTHYGQIARRLMEDAKERAESLGAEKVFIEVEAGDAVQVILDHARHHDLVVLGHRGLGAAGRQLAGSVAYGVSQLVDAACLIVK